MNPVFLALVALLAATPALGDTVVAAHTIRAQTVLTADHLNLAAGETGGPFTSFDEVIGQEARVAIYAGHPIRPGDIGPPAIVERNAVVPLLYQRMGLAIFAEGRALGRAGAGDRLRVMNLQSRQTVSGVVRPDGTVIVSPMTSPLPAN